MSCGGGRARGWGTLLGTGGARRQGHAWRCARQGSTRACWVAQVRCRQRASRCAAASAPHLDSQHVPVDLKPAPHHHFLRVCTAVGGRAEGLVLNFGRYEGGREGAREAAGVRTQRPQMQRHRRRQPAAQRRRRPTPSTSGAACQVVPSHTHRSAGFPRRACERCRWPGGGLQRVGRRRGAVWRARRRRRRGRSGSLARAATQSACLPERCTDARRAAKRAERVKRTCRETKRPPRGCSAARHSLKGPGWWPSPRGGASCT